MHSIISNRMRRHSVLTCIIVCLMIGMAQGPKVQAQGNDDALFINAEGQVGIGNRTPRAPLDVTGEIRGVGMVPPGGIVMFSGKVAECFDGDGKGLNGTPYEGWQLCNGKNSAPDLSNRFILSSAEKNGDDIGHTGGADKVTLAIEHLPSHNHGGKTGDGTTKLPKILKGTAARKAGLVVKTTSVSGPDMEDKTHQHSIASEGGGKAHENMPPYYILAFIMRLPQ